MKITRKINKLFSICNSKEVDGAEVWMLTWTSYVSGYVGTNEVTRAKAFLNRCDAEQYADSLEKANKLLENKTGLNINIEKQK